MTRFLLKISNFLENERGSCPSSSPSGNQVDGSPLVAIYQTVAKRARRGGCTPVLLTMKNWLLKMSAAMKVLVNDEFVLKHILKFIENGIEM